MNIPNQRKPAVSGQPFKTRQGDEKERFDPTDFPGCIIQGLAQTGTDLQAVAEFLDASGAKLAHCRWAHALSRSLPFRQPVADDVTI